MATLERRKPDERGVDRYWARGLDVDRHVDTVRLGEPTSGRHYKAKRCCPVGSLGTILLTEPHPSTSKEQVAQPDGAATRFRESPFAEIHIAA